MAATPGSVVYRSDLIELIQYEPQVKRVHSVPLLFCPPWINKYYIMDLAPGKSLIEWAVQHGHTCFAISYRNPDASMRDLDFEDYLRKGPLDAVRVVREITGAAQVNTLSVCLGGTLTAIALAHNAAIGDRSIKSATFLNTHTDFSAPGALGVFTDEATIAGLEKQMAKKGYLDSDKMAHTFDALRANDLVFQYVVNNWLLGKKPPAFDLLVWNKDSTRMPAKMHSHYLRSCYLNNEFARGEFEIDGIKLEPGQGRHRHLRARGGRRPHRPVGLRLQDRAAARRSQPLRAQHLRPHRRHRQPARPQGQALDQRRSARRTRRSGRTTPQLQDGTWWEDWATWIAEQGGPKVAPPAPARQQGPPADRARAGQLRAHPRMTRTRLRTYDRHCCCASAGSASACASRASGTPLLLLNGLTRPAGELGTVHRPLTGRTVVTFDAARRRREPDTARCRSPISTLAALAAAVLDALGLDRADVLGFSHGGAVAQQLAVHDPGGSPSVGARLHLVRRRRDPRRPGALRSLAPPSGSRLLASPRRRRRALALARHRQLVEHPVPRRDPSSHPGRLRGPRPGRAAGEQRVAGSPHPGRRAGRARRPATTFSGEGRRTRWSLPSSPSWTPPGSRRPRPRMSDRRVPRAVLASTCKTPPSTAGRELAAATAEGGVGTWMPSPPGQIVRGVRCLRP